MTRENVYFKPARGYHQISRLKTNPSEAILLQHGGEIRQILKRRM
jgi:hypothetical protein